MSIFLEDIGAIFTLFAPATGTVTAALVAFIMFLGFVAPLFEFVRYERRWWEDS